MKIVIEMYDGELLKGRIVMMRSHGVIVNIGYFGMYNLTSCEGIVNIFEYPNLNWLLTVRKYHIANGNKISGV